MYNVYKTHVYRYMYHLSYLDPSSSLDLIIILIHVDWSNEISFHYLIYTCINCISISKSFSLFSRHYIRFKLKYLVQRIFSITKYMQIITYIVQNKYARLSRMKSKKYKCITNSYSIMKKKERNIITWI